VLAGLDPAILGCDGCLASLLRFRDGHVFVPRDFPHELPVGSALEGAVGGDGYQRAVVVRFGGVFLLGAFALGAFVLGPLITGVDPGFTFGLLRGPFLGGLSLLDHLELLRRLRSGAAQRAG
jgi:hypothetical protein